MKDVIIGRVALTNNNEPRLFVTDKKSAALTVYCGTPYNRDENAEKVHLNVTAWFSYSTEKLLSLKGGEVVMITGQLKEHKGDTQELQLQVDNNNLTIMSDDALAGWGIYPCVQELCYINGAFPSQSGGYSLSCRTNYYTPYYKKAEGGLYEKVDANDQRQLKYNIGSKSNAFTAINKLLSRLTGNEITTQASQEVLDLLKNYYIVVEDGFANFSDKKVQVGDSTRQSLYMNRFAQRIMFIYKHEKGGQQQKAVSKKSETNKPANKPQAKPKDDIPFGEPIDGFAQGNGYDNKITF